MGGEMRLSLLLLFVFLWGCASNGAIDAPSTSTREAKPVSQSGLVQVQEGANELVAMLCSSQKHAQAIQLLKQHQVSLLKQSSPTILTLSWSDERSAKQVIQDLQQSNTVFCGIESNQIYNNAIK
jgi:hypothetical protein